MRKAILSAADGCMIHFYTFASETEGFLTAENLIHNESKLAGKIATITEKRIVRPFAPGVNQIVIDFKVLPSKNNL